VKLNWGTGIVITIIVFPLISFAMIFHFMNQKVDLVTDNYYEKTLVYQNQIDEAIFPPILRDRGSKQELEKQLPGLRGILISGLIKDKGRQNLDLGLSLLERLHQYKPCFLPVAGMDELHPFRLQVEAPQPLE
jgi:hypothetical protein